MYASNLQEILFHCSARSDVSPQDFADFTERFNSLRGYGHLPKGRDQRKARLGPKQIAASVLGLVPVRPGWAGHGATILENLAPVGGLKNSFYKAASLGDAVALLLTNADALNSLVALRVAMGETATNSTGAAALTYVIEGVRREAFFVSSMAVSLTQEDAAPSFDFEKRLNSLSSREMRFGKSFFMRISREIEISARYSGEPAGDGAEYDEEEAKQALWKKLKVTPRSRFMNLAADNHVTWPRETTLVKFDNYHFVLMPRTNENVQSVHIDLVANSISESSAATIIQRFLSVMAWCDNSFATLGFGWSGNPVPVAVPRPDLAFRTASHYVFDRKVPSTPKARRALALYREALNAEHNELIGYAVLSYYKIIELTQRDRGATKNWFRDNFQHVRGVVRLERSLAEFDKLRGAIAPHEYIYKSCRIAVAHAGKDSESDPDDASELRRLHFAAEIMQVLARYCIETNFKISDCMFDGT